MCWCSFLIFLVMVFLLFTNKQTNNHLLRSSLSPQQKTLHPEQSSSAPWWGRAAHPLHLPRASPPGSVHVVSGRFRSFFVFGAWREMRVRPGKSKENVILGRKKQRKRGQTKGYKTHINKQSLSGRLLGVGGAQVSSFRFHRKDLRFLFAWSGAAHFGWKKGRRNAPLPTWMDKYNVQWCLWCSVRWSLEGLVRRPLLKHFWHVAAIKAARSIFCRQTEAINTSMARQCSMLSPNTLKSCAHQGFSSPLYISFELLGIKQNNPVQLPFWATPSQILIRI